MGSEVWKPLPTLHHFFYFIKEHGLFSYLWFFLKISSIMKLTESIGRSLLCITEFTILRPTLPYPTKVFWVILANLISCIYMILNLNLKFPFYSFGYITFVLKTFLLPSEYFLTKIYELFSFKVCSFGLLCTVSELTKFTKNKWVQKTSKFHHHSIYRKTEWSLY